MAPPGCFGSSPPGPVSQESKSVNTVAFGAGKKSVVWGVGSENHVIRN